MENHFTFQVYFLLTQQCSLQCKHCIRRYGEKNENIVTDFSMIDIAFSKLKKLTNSKIQLILTGGEPTLHRDFKIIFENAVKSFGNVSVCTNGFISDDIISYFINNKDFVDLQISIDGMSLIHNEIRSRNCFDAILKNLQRLTENNVKVTVASTVNKLNYTSMLEMPELLEKFNIHCWNVSPEQFFDSTSRKRALDVEEWNILVNKLLRLVNFRVSIKKLFDFDLFEKMEKRYGKVFIEKNLKANCGFCNSKLYIYPDFSIYPCTCVTDINLGNLIHTNVKKILENIDKVKKLSVTKEIICLNCHWNYLCKGGCPGYSYNFFKEFGHGDIRCPKLQERN